jgi:F-box-like
VFSYLPLRDLLSCHRVSKRWRAVATSDPSFYRLIDLLSATKPLTKENVSALVRNAVDDIRSLKIHSLHRSFSQSYFIASGNVKNYKSHANAHLGELFKNLERFDAIHSIHDSTREADFLFSLPQFPCSSLRQIKMECCIDIQQLEQICKCAQQLERLDCVLAGLPPSMTDPIESERDRFPSLKTLAIRVVSLPGRVEIDTITIHKILHWFSSLEELCFWDMSGVVQFIVIGNTSTKMKKLRVHGGARICAVNVLRGFLATLDVRDLPGLAILPNDLHSASQFDELILQSVPRLDSQILPHFYPSASKLKILTLSSPQFEVRDVEYFIREGVNLKSLNVNALRYVNDATLRFLHNLKLLEQLYIDDCPGITGHGIIQLINTISVKRGGRLTFISSKGNESIRRQTIDWARNLGVIITI